MKSSAALAFVLAFVAASKAAPETANADLTVTYLDRNLDMTTQLVKETTKLTIANNGKSPAKVVHFAVDPQLFDSVTFIGATTGKSSKVYPPAVPVDIKGAKGSVKGWKFELKGAIGAGQSETVEVQLTLGKAFKMFPADITQKEKQLVVFNGNHYAYSPYTVKSQSTKVTLASSNVESYSKLKPVSQNENTLTYGPYSDIGPFSSDKMNVHFENNSPFLVITSLERTVELSMWGNIAVSETIDVRHIGAKLKGAFSRLDFQRDKASASAVNSFKTVLPASASSVYYRDDVGNISTSALKVHVDSVEVDLRPRFPLFGGWKTHYTIGYDVPSYEYLYTDGDDYVMNMRLLDHVFDDMIVEDFTLNIILPEGCEGSRLEAPYPVKRLKSTLHFTYLDTKGRPVISIKNVGTLSEKHIQDFKLAFKFPRLSMIREPLLLIAAFFAFFVLAMVYVRLDFAIVKDEESETRLKVAGFCEKVAVHQEKRVGLYNTFENLLVMLKSNKDTSLFQANSKKMMTDHKAETSSIGDLANVLKPMSPDVYEKIMEMQKQDRTFREHQTSQAGLIEKLVTGKLGKQVFIDQDAVIVKKKDECLEKMDAILSHMRSL